MKSRSLFLFGGSPPFTRKLEKKFANKVLNKKGKVGILFVKQDGWESYMPRYTCVLEEHGVQDFSYLPLSEELNEKVLHKLRSCTGIIIGGGETEHYRDFIVDTEVGNVI